MELSPLDLGVFIGFIGLVIGVSLYASRREDTTEDYFLAGRNLTWGLVGLSLIASNISTEHFVGMAGQGASDVGMAVASYEWMATITLVVVALVFLPRFLKSGIFTMPQFLEYRYCPAARTIMAFYMMVVLVLVSITAVLYSGGLALCTIFGEVTIFGQVTLNLSLSIWLIGILAGIYTVYGGLKAVVWSDLIQGAALLIGGLIVMFLCFDKVGGFNKFLQSNSEKLHVFLPADHPEIPWTALVIGLWIPNFYYWGLNQFITQRTLASKSLKQGQKGILLAAALKLLIPFIIVFPGIAAVQLYGDQLQNYDQAYPVLIRNILPAGLRGIMFAALFGAIMSSLDSMLNSASTIFTIDLYKRHIKKQASSKNLIATGRTATALFVVIGCLVAPKLGSFKGIFHFIQEFQGYISPGILAAFIFGMIIRRAPARAGVCALLLNVPIYGALHLLPKFGVIPPFAFLNRIAITFGIIILLMALLTIWKPLPQPKVISTHSDLDMTSSVTVKIFGGVLIAITIALYIIFR